VSENNFKKNNTYGMTQNKTSLHRLKVSKKRRKSWQETEIQTGNDFKYDRMKCNHISSIPIHLLCILLLLDPSIY
jgi:hypothetical protein